VTDLLTDEAPTALSLAERLELELRLPRRLVAQELRLLWAVPDLRQAYTAYLVTMHAIVRATVPLMELALACVRQRSPHEAAETPEAHALGELERYLRRHVREERGHDAWILEDLAAAGADPAMALDGLPSPAVASLVGAQHYWVAHVHPVALLGHIAVMEGSPPSAAGISRLREETGFGEDAFRSLSRHAVLDRSHAHDVAALLGRITLPARLEWLVGTSALHTAAGVAGVIAEVRREVDVP
jgi:hypothetical protein